MMQTSISLLVLASALGASAQQWQTPPPGPADPSTIKTCTYWALADAAATSNCKTFASDLGVPFADFQKWNPAVKSDCSGMKAGNAYCVENNNGDPDPTTPPTQEPTTPAPTPTGPVAPGPTQDGQDPKCNKWDFVKAGENCQTFIKKYPGLTMELLSKWNSAIGDDCSGLWAKTYLCIGIEGWTPGAPPAPTTPTTPTDPSIPSPTLDGGHPADCNNWHLVKAGDSCDNIAKAAGITTSDFIAWNPQVQTDCSGLWAKYYVCTGTKSQKPPASTTTTAPPGGNPTPTPIQDGVPSDCKAWHLVKAGDTCQKIADDAKVSLDQFYKWNPAVGGDCSGLWVKYYVCTSSGSSTPPPTTTAPPSGNPTPTPIQDGVPSDCKAWHLVKAGDTCQKIADDAKVSIDQFYKWNPAVGADCSSLWAKYYVCTAAGSSTTPPPTTTKIPGDVTPPSPTQDGQPSDCNEWHLVVSGDQCANIAKKADLPLDVFYKWNPSVGSDCAGLWLKYYVCIDTKSYNHNHPPTPTGGNGVATPSPIQDGMTTRCNRFYKVKKGDTCAAIAQGANVNLDQFYKWNLAVGSDCSSLWLNTYVCTGTL